MDATGLAQSESAMQNDTNMNGNHWVNGYNHDKQQSEISKFNTGSKLGLDLENGWPSRTFEVPEGMARSVFHNKYARKKENGEYQTWAERIYEVIEGNFKLDTDIDPTEYELSHALGKAGVLFFSGRHLQHGDLDQPDKPMERFTNCTTAIFTFLTFQLLLDGSGVGSDYSTRNRRVNWDLMPNMRLVLDGGMYDDGDTDNGAHPDFKSVMNEFGGFFESKRDAQHKYPSESEKVRWFTVEDSREGWTKVVEILETAAFQGRHSDKLFIFDFSYVREAGQPIRGQQNRPASGPLPFMRALAKIATIKGAFMQPWMQAMFIDHYLASCVALGGVRRSARMATKMYTDHDIFDFIEIKRNGHLPSANNAILVDQKFWQDIEDPRTHAFRVFQAACAAAYFDQTGEPNFINVDKLNSNEEGIQEIDTREYINQSGTDLQVHDKTKDMISNILNFIIKNNDYKFIVNPCSEIPLALWGGYCVVGDCNLAQAQNKAEAINTVRLQAKALVRVNRMKALYRHEVNRTNRIGVSLIGIYEYMWRMFGLGFREAIDAFDYFIEGDLTKQPTQNAWDWWHHLNLLRQHAEDAAGEESDKYGLPHPHTATTLKPGGTVPKVAGATESANLPNRTYYIRWNQFQKEIRDGERDPELAELERRGYPSKDVSNFYKNAVVVGFPTKAPVVDVVDPDHVVTAEEASVDEHYRWLQLLENFWMGKNEDGSPRNGQISYTLKFNPNKITYEDFMQMIKQHQPNIRCCAFDAVFDIGELKSVFPYVPEEPISKEYYDYLVGNTESLEFEPYGDDQVNCENGACPIEGDTNEQVSVLDQ